MKLLPRQSGRLKVNFYFHPDGFLNVNIETGFRRATRRFWAAGPMLALLILLTAACGGNTPSAPEKHYTLTGEVVSVDPKLQTASIKHDPIKGWMDETMTMDYPIRSKAEFAELHPGDRITATVNVRGIDYDLSNIRKLTPAK